MASNAERGKSLAQRNQSNLNRGVSIVLHSPASSHCIFFAGDGDSCNVQLSRRIVLDKMWVQRVLRREVHSALSGLLWGRATILVDWVGELSYCPRSATQLYSLGKCGQVGSTEFYTFCVMTQSINPLHFKLCWVVDARNDCPKQWRRERRGTGEC